MNIEEYRDYCLSKKAVSESFPFNSNTLVFKVANKMFALCDVESFEYVNLKENPERSVQLREEYDGVKPGYHMNKAHWNSVYTNSDVEDALLYELIDNSYNLIVESLSKKVKNEWAL